MLIEWWSAGQEISGIAKGARDCREGSGKSEGRIKQKRCRNREVTAISADDPRGTEYQRETDQRPSRVSNIL